MQTAASSTVLRLHDGQRIRHWWRLFGRACASAYRDNALGTSKAAAYSALLAFFPLLTSVTAILVQANARAVSAALARMVFQVVPPGTEEIVQYNFMERGARPASLLVVATLLSLWAASGLMMSLMDGFRAAYRIETPRPLVRQRLVAIGLVFCTALPMVLAAALIVWGARLERLLLEVLGVIEKGQILTGWVHFAAVMARGGVAFGAVVAATTLLYRIGPNRPNRLREVWPGAVLAASLWTVVTYLFGWYVRTMGNYNVLYGSVGAAIALMVWMYLLALVCLVGCEFNAERERFGSLYRSGATVQLSYPSEY